MRKLQTMGAEVMGSGRATISARFSEADFKRVFGAEPIATAATPPSARDQGGTAGHYVEADIEIPASLADEVEHVSVEPGALRLA